MQELCATPLCGLREPASSLSHLLGAAVFAACAVQLLQRARGDSGRLLSVGVLVYTTIQTLICSSIYHMNWPGPTREFFLRADVAGIFLLIAGCMTPIHMILLRGVWRWLPLALAWTVAVSGAARHLAGERAAPGVSGTLVFIFFGWGAVLTAIKLGRDRGWRFVQLPILSGLTFTLGAVLLLQGRPTLIPGVIGPHEVWHVAVLCALALHWGFVYRISAPAACEREVTESTPVSLPLEQLQPVPANA